MNSVIRPIFNKNFIEKRYLWVPWTVHGIHWKVHNLTCGALLQEKRKKETQKDGFHPYPNYAFGLASIVLRLCFPLFFLFFFLLTCAFHMGVSVSESCALCTGPTTSLTIQIFTGMALFNESRVLFIRPTNLFIQQLFY